MVNSILVAWIFNTIEPTLRSTITYMENVKELWDDLHQRFSIGNGPRVHQLKADLAACKQQGATVVTYYGRLKVMWDELVNYEPIPMCKCGGCKCNMSSALEKKRDDEKVHQFLMGLDDAVYNTMRSNILSTHPLPNINMVYAMVIQEERHRRIARSGEEQSDGVGFSAQMGSQVRAAAVREKDKQGSCAHCGRSGHDAKSCYQIIGYPDWWGERPRGNEKGVGRGKVGGPSGRARANVTRTATDIGTTSSESQFSEDRPGFPNLSNDQWATLLEMLNQNKNGGDRLSGKTNSNNRIVDSGVASRWE